MSDTRGGIEALPDPADAQAQPAPAILKHFEYRHLPSDLAAVSEKFSLLAHYLASQFQGDELEAALNRLVEAKDWAVRAARAANP
ncbi:MAG TPA: hypothetical protein VKU39_05215 [Streptosporangiaceae bacterium]|nr:hypothetical protein [Streptosporangiaceae bacterium]